jgi:hypothetical protein
MSPMANEPHQNRALRQIDGVATMSFWFSRRRKGNGKTYYSVTVLIPAMVFFVLLAGILVMKFVHWIF